MIHFGINFKKSKFGFSLTRENYIHPSKKSSFNNTEYDDEYIISHTKRALFNFDLNMRFFSKLDSEEFNRTIENFSRQYPQFIEIKDLNEYRYQSGYYLLVLDKYKQIYLGTTHDICRRIREHWTGSKQFDRLIFGTVFTSRLSIDSFRPLDTTRIFVYTTNKTFENEDKFISYFPDKFILNRTKGGILKLGLSESISNRKYRNLIDI